MSTEELVARRFELSPAADREARTEERRSALQERINQARERLDAFEAQREAAMDLPRRQRKVELSGIDAYETASLRATTRLEAEAQEMPALGLSQAGFDGDLDLPPS